MIVRIEPGQLNRVLWGDGYLEAILASVATASDATLLNSYKMVILYGIRKLN